MRNIFIGTKPVKGPKVLGQTTCFFEQFVSGKIVAHSTAKKTTSSLFLSLFPSLPVEFCCGSKLNVRRRILISLQFGKHVELKQLKETEFQDCLLTKSSKV